MKKIVIFILSFCVLLTQTNMVYYAAELVEHKQGVDILQEDDSIKKTGLMRPEMVIEQYDESMEVLYDYKELANMKSYALVYDDSWDKYGTNFYYNQLPAQWKELWDAMDVLCLSYLNDTEDLTNRVTRTLTVPSEITVDEIFNLFFMYLYSNPQYYFLYNGFSISRDSEGIVHTLIFKIYDDFIDGNSRMVATTAIKNQIEAWEMQLKAYSTDQEKVQAIHQLIGDKVTYNYDFVNGAISEQDAFSQCIYSVLCMDSTVCAGYADTLSLMCNGVGIDAISVTSLNHQWNKIRLDDSWYNFDLTWSDDDYIGKIYYDYYGRSDSYYNEIGSHEPEEFWGNYVPIASLNATVDSYYSPNIEWPIISKTTSTPEIIIQKGQSVYVNIGCATENAQIYYTLDGTTPTVAAGKSIKYTEPFKVEEDCSIKAIAVCDTYWDSLEASCTNDMSQNIILEKPYKIANVVSGVHVYWKEPENGAEKYGLWRSENGVNGTYKWIANPMVPHFTDTKVESGKTYYYKVTVCDPTTNTHGEKSEAIGIIFTSTPDITSRVNKAAGIQLGWQKINGATGYAIYRKSYSGNDAWTRVATIEGNSTFTWTDTSAKTKNGTIYKYTIRALAGENMKTLSGCRNTGRTMVRLSSRVLNSAVKASKTSIKCNWTTSSAVTGYEVRFMVGDEIYKTVTVGNYKTGTKTFTGLKTGQTYKVQVRSYKKVSGVGSFYSAWSTEKNVTLK